MVPGDGRYDDEIEAIRRSLGQRIRDCRLELNLTQEDLADSTGLDRGYLSSIENGRRSPGLDVLYLLARGLNLPLADLLHDL